MNKIQTKKYEKLVFISSLILEENRKIKENTFNKTDIKDNIENLNFLGQYESALYNDLTEDDIDKMILYLGENFLEDGLIESLIWINSHNSKLTKDNLLINYRMRYNLNSVLISKKKLDSKIEHNGTLEELEEFTGIYIDKLEKEDHIFRRYFKETIYLMSEEEIEFYYYDKKNTEIIKMFREKIKNKKIVLGLDENIRAKLDLLVDSDFIINYISLLFEENIDLNISLSDTFDFVFMNKNIEKKALECQFNFNEIINYLHFNDACIQNQNYINLKFKDKCFKNLVVSYLNYLETSNQDIVDTILLTIAKNNLDEEIYNYVLENIKTLVSKTKLYQKSL